MDGKQFSFPFICHDSKVDLKLISNLRIQRILSSVVFEKYFAIKKLKYHSFTFEKSFPYRNSFRFPRLYSYPPSSTKGIPTRNPKAVIYLCRVKSFERCFVTFAVQSERYRSGQNELKGTIGK